MSHRKLVGYLTLAWVPHAVAYVVAPNAVAAATVDSALTVGFGAWSVLAALPFLAAGTGMIGWSIVTHYRDSPDELQLSLPSYLSTAGAYGVSRNPLYLGGALLWVGWAISWRSAAVAAAAVVLFAFLALVGIPFEERRLRARHGAAYDAYCAAVPRWLSLRRRRPRSEQSSR